MSKWRAGCDESITVYIPKGYTYVAREVRCGSTSFTGGVNQCEKCAAKRPMPEPLEDEGDMEYFERTSGYED